MDLREYLDADWSRLHEFAGLPAKKRRFRDNFSPRFAPVYLLRKAQHAFFNGRHKRAKLFSLINFLLFGLEVPARLKIGPGLVLPHTSGTILGAGEIGKNVTIYQQVTLGAKIADFEYDPKVRPRVGDNVLITAGAKIIGPVSIGDGAIIGANAVVLADVPSRHLAIGVPATAREIAENVDYVAAQQ